MFHFLGGSAEQSAFVLLKEKMANPILMHHFQPGKGCTIEVDACGYAIGGILLQDNKPVALCHKLLRANELNWDTRSKELFAIFYSVKKFHYFIDGEDIFLKSDHQSLQYFKPMKINGRVARWILQMSPYNISIQYIEGENNTRADMLSRLNEVFDRVPGLDTVMAVTRSMRNDQSADANDVDLKQLHETLVHISGSKLHESV